jgi:hypothetical protein
LLRKGEDCEGAEEANPVEMEEVGVLTGREFICCRGMFMLLYASGKRW